MAGIEDTRRPPLGDGKKLEENWWCVEGYAVGYGPWLTNQSRSVCIGGIFHLVFDGDLYGS